MNAFLIIWTVTGVIAAVAIGNRRKGRPWLGLLLGLLLGWIGVIIIAVIPPTHAKLVQRERERLLVEREARGIFMQPEAGLPPGFIPPSAAMTPPPAERGERAPD